MITINSNSAAARLMRYLSQASSAQSQASERLSSGLRINRASDDAAGLAIISSTEARSRVFGQGLRNLNDGISALNIASSALEGLNNIVTRLKELAEQSANGTYSLSQRQRLAEESRELVDEFNRITKVTAFNGRVLLDGISTLAIQAGFGSEEMLSMRLGAEMARNIGERSFVSTNTGLFLNSDQGRTGDINGDGRDDLVYNSADGSGQILVRLGNADGTLATDSVLVTIGSADPSVDLSAIALGDMDGDGDLDLVTSGNTPGESATRVFTNDGSGNFTLQTTRADIIGAGTDLRLADVDGDGSLDLAFAVGSDVRIYAGDGSGDFASSATVVSNIALGYQLFDVNRDGRLDIVDGQAGLTTQEIRTRLNTGGFGFGAIQSSTVDIPDVTSFSTLRIGLGDFDGDGQIDLIASSVSVTLAPLAVNYQVAMLRGNGDGTFSNQQNISSTGQAAADVTTGDFDGDGNLDFAVGHASGSGTGAVFFGNGAGQFSRTDLAGTGYQIMAADFNGDGVKDFYSNTRMHRQRATQTGSIAYLDLTSAATARQALTTLDAIQRRLSLEQGAIGSLMSRFNVAAATLSARRENLDAATARIKESDVAATSADFTRSQILQRTASAVLAQANQQPALALQLLRLS